MSFLSDTDYSDFLEQRIRAVEDGTARDHIREKFQAWGQQYRAARVVERTAELLALETTRPNMLYLRSEVDLHLLRFLAQRHYFDPQRFRGFLVEDQLWGSLQPEWFAPFPVERISAWRDNESTVVLTFSDSRPYRDNGRDRGNDYLERFIDLSRLSFLTDMRQEAGERPVVLYADYRKVKTLEALAEVVSGRYMTVGLVADPETKNNGYAHLVREPHFYLWPMVFKTLNPDIVHVNVGWSTQGLPFMPFVPDADRAVVDFYDVLTLMEDKYLEKHHPEPCHLTRASDNYLWTHAQHFIHRNGSAITEGLLEKYPDKDIVSVLEYLKDPVFSQMSEKTNDVSLVYGGIIIQDASDLESVYYSRFRAMVDFFARDNLHLHIYQSPYLYGFGPPKAVETLVRTQGLTNVHACNALEEDEWVREIARYDYGIFIFGDTQPAPCPHILPFKFVTYLRAGLPMIVPEDQTLMADLVRDNDIGIVYRREDCGRMPEIIAGYDVNALKENVVRFRSSLGIAKGGEKVGALYDRILGKATGPGKTTMRVEKPALAAEPATPGNPPLPRSELDLEGRTFLSEAEYTRFLESRLEQASPGPDRDHVLRRFQEWAQGYHIERMRQRAGELLSELRGQPFALYLDGALSLQAAAHLLNGSSAEACAACKGFVVEDDFLATQDVRLFQPYPVCPRSRSQDVRAAIFSMSGSVPKECAGTYRANDYREKFIDLRRFAQALEQRRSFKPHAVVLYPLYREIHTVSIMAQAVRKMDQELRGFSLSPKPLINGNYDAMLVEPFFYLWPLIFQMLDPDLVHLNVGWGIQALALSPFIPDRRRTVVDLYEVLSFLPDVYFNKTHSSAEEVRMGEAHFVKNYDHVMHLCSEEITTKLEEKYDPHGSIVSVTEYLEEPTYSVPPRGDGTIRLVYGGCMLATTNPDDLYYKAFVKIAPYYARENLHLYIYNSPYVHGIVENDGLKEVLQKLGLTNVHPCTPLKLDEFARKISEYDYGAMFLRPKDMDGLEYNYFMATKFLTYLRAGLPVVIEAENHFMASLVNRYQIGIVLHEYDLENLVEILNNADLLSLQRNVLKFRDRFSIDKGGAKVLDIYRRILEPAHHRRIFPAADPVPSKPKAVEQAVDFDNLITSMADAENRLYYRDQSAQTMSSLARYARELDPSVIVELGTLAGLSLRTWIASTQEAKIYAVDLSFATLKATQRFLPVDLSRVTLLEQDILKTDFPSLWTAQDRVIFFVDAHDLPGVPIMEHVLNTALPSLPDGSVVIVDDLWFSPARLTCDNAQVFLDDHVVREIDELQCFEGHYAPYHEGGSFMGFAEVGPLLKFVNAHGISLVYEKGGKHVSFVWKSAYLSEDRAAGFPESAECCGSVVHNPLMRVPVSPRLQQTMGHIAADYQQKRIAQATETLSNLVAQHSRDSGLAYGLAVCLARRGGLAQARDVLSRVIDDTNDSHCRRLFDDLVERVGPCPSQTSTTPVPQAHGTGLTIFAMPKAFTGHNGIIQKNAMRSWARLNPTPEIILFGDEPGIGEMAREIGARHEPHVERNEFGTPLVNKLFGAAQNLASNRVVAYVNADMILFDDFVQAVRTVQEQLPTFLLIGRRWDFTLLDEIEFTSGWQDRLRRRATEEGILHAECGLDYFVFTPEVYPEIPPFAIGRTAWDNWLVRAPRMNGVPVIDGSDAVLVIHQDHHYGHVAGGRDEAWHGKEAARNRSLAGDVDGYGYTTGAAWALNKACQLVQVQPRRAEFGSVDYRARRSNWLAQQARRLMAAEALELAACRWEESLMFLDKLMDGKLPEDTGPDLLNNAGIGECYKAGCALLAQCYMKLEWHDRVVATYTRLLQTPGVFLPQEQRDEIIRVRDQLRERLLADKALVSSSNPTAKAIPATPKIRRAPRGAGPAGAVPRDRRIALVVSMPQRLEGLLAVVRSIETQVDDIRILLNESDTVPPQLRDWGKVSTVVTSSKGELFATGAWTLLRPEDEGYILVFDDDIHYPADYAERMIAKIEDHGRRAVAVVHAMDFSEPFEDYIRDRVLYHFQEGQEEDQIVHVGGIGTAVFHTSTLRPDLRNFPDPSFRDLWFAILAAKQKVPIVRVAREAGWLRSMEVGGKKLWRMCYQREWRGRKNRVFREHLVPLLRDRAVQPQISRDDFTIFSFTNGRSTYEYSARSLVESWDRQEEVVVLRDMHFPDAVHKCLESCTTPYFIKVDDDFILHPKAIAYLRRRVLEYPQPEELGIYYCHLWEDWTSRVRQSIKVYRTEALRQIGGFQANHQGKVDEATKAALREAGFKVVKDPSAVALHACGSWQEQLEYERLWSSLADRPYRKPTHDSMKQYCGTKSLDEQYAMRLGVLEYVNQQLNTPFHEFLMENAELGSPAAAGPAQTPGRRGAEGRQASITVGPMAGSDGSPKVSVVTVCRNAQAHLPECLDSILGQTLPAWELLLIDDGSTDSTNDIISNYAQRDGRIKAARFDESTGPYVRRNYAIQKARSPFIVIQDADDIMAANKLQVLHEAITRDDRLGVVGSFYRKFLDEFRGAKYTEPVALVTTHEQILEAYQTQTLWDFTWHASAILRRTLFETIGPYDENPFGADSFWLAKVAEYAAHTGQVRLANTPEFLTFRRIHNSSQTGILPPSDPRGARVRYWQYCRGKLQRLKVQMRENPRMDLARALRECTCGDFLPRFHAKIIAWEGQRLDSRVVPYFLRNAVTYFNTGHYVSCVRILRDVETMEPAVSRCVVHFNLLRAMALMALGLEPEALTSLEGELERHNSAAARQFYQDYFEQGLHADVEQWCAENAERYNLGLFESDNAKLPSLVRA